MSRHNAKTRTAAERLLEDILHRKNYNSATHEAVQSFLENYAEERVRKTTQEMDKIRFRNKRLLQQVEDLSRETERFLRNAK